MKLSDAVPVCPYATGGHGSYKSAACHKNTHLRQAYSHWTQGSENDQGESICFYKI